jgi:hypothetical protein
MTCFAIFKQFFGKKIENLNYYYPQYIHIFFAPMSLFRLKDRGPFPSLYLLISTLGFLFALYYAWAHLWEFDEGWTYLSVQHESFGDLLAYKHFNIANHHLINSLWFKTLQLAGCRYAIGFRALSLLSYLPYAWFLYAAATYRTEAWPNRSYAWFTLFFIPPSIVYFGAGRGYALAIAFFVGALYYLKVCLEERKAGAYWKFILCGTISSLAIVSFFYPFAAMLAYLFLMQFRIRIRSIHTILSGILLLALTLYVYHIGKTILLNDVIINGSDSLVAGGMYSTFLATLTLYNITPFPHLYDVLRLETVSKITVMASFLPVGLILIWKYLRKHTELIILVIATFLFLVSHFLLQAKYPSDRSVLYLLYLIYIPVVLVIIKTSNIFFRIHYFIAVFWSALNLIGFIYIMNKQDIYTALEQKPTRTYTVYSDWPNFADGVYSQLRFHDRIQFHYMAKSYETDMDLVDRNIKAALSDPHADFILLQKSAWLRNKALFETGYDVQPVISSGAKELYLIKRTGP